MHTELETLYWPYTTGRLSRRLGLCDSDYVVLLHQYSRKALQLVGTLDPHIRRKSHEWMRIEAARMDESNTLNLLHRLATWHQREKLKGRISGALWIRHIAEVIRR